MDQTPSPVSGRFRLLGPDGSELEASEATFLVEAEALVVQPKAQATLRVDFADADGMELGDYVTRLLLATGERVELSVLGRRNNELVDALSNALRAFQAKNLLLEEPVGGEAFACDVAREGREAPAEVRVYATSLAVLPRAEVPFSIPFGELRGYSFDEGRWAVDLDTGEGKVGLLRLAKKTQPFLRLLEERVTALRKRGAEAVGFLLPQVPSLAARRVAQAMADGVPARRAELDAISPSIWPALLKSAVASADLRRCADELAALCPAGEIALGIKETNARQDSEEAEAPEPEEAAPVEGESADAEATDEPAEDAEGPMANRVAWFAFPIIHEDRSKPGNAVAIEAVTRSGRATYFFRIAPPDVYRQASWEELLGLARERIRSVSRALVRLSFKREPIYLTDEALAAPRFARYRLALRLSAPLKASRATFLGRAIHGKPWRKQVDAALSKAVSGG